MFLSVPKVISWQNVFETITLLWLYCANWIHFTISSNGDTKRHKQNSLELWNQARLFMKDNCQSGNKQTDAKQTTNRICVGKFWINRRSCCKPQVMEFNYKYEIYNSHLARHSLAPARFIFHVNSFFLCWHAVFCQCPLNFAKPVLSVMTLLSLLLLLNIIFNRMLLRN